MSGEWSAQWDSNVEFLLSLYKTFLGVRVQWTLPIEVPWMLSLLFIYVEFQQRITRETAHKRMNDSGTFGVNYSRVSMFIYPGISGILQKTSQTTLRSLYLIIPNNVCIHACIHAYIYGYMYTCMYADMCRYVCMIYKYSGLLEYTHTYSVVSLKVPFPVSSGVRSH